MSDQPTRLSKTAPLTIPAVPVTPLYDEHLAAKARMVEFGGWLMPLQYTGIIDEHRAVRTAAGLFDVSHMGEVELAGPGALDALQRLCSNDASRLAVGAAMYTVACNERGGIVDDWIVYRLTADRYRIVTNAANHAKDFAWCQAQVQGRCELVDLSDTTALLALQGPRAAAILAQAWRGAELTTVKGFHAVTGAAAGIPVLAARTGYTGEDGFELFCDASEAPALWRALLELGRSAGLQPCGLGCRDTLRLEARLALYGNELTDETTPLEAGLDRWVALDKGDFLGRDALLRQRAAGLTRKLVGLQVTGRGIARHGYGIHRATAQTTAYETATEPVRSAGEPAGGDGSTGRGGAGPGAGVSAPQVTPVAAGSQGEARSPQPLGSTIGEITSGAPSPTLEYPIALGYVAISASATGTELLVDCRGKPTAARVVSGPFYRRGR